MLSIVSSTNPLSLGYVVPQHDPEQRALWQQRWQAQLTKAEPDAPIDPRTGKRKTYAKFDCYVRAKVWYELCQNEKGGS